MKLKEFKKSEFIKEVKAKYGSLSKLKKYLKEISVDEYGCYTSEVSIYGCRVLYTSNPNCWASYLVTIPMVGMSNQLGLDKSSITNVGHQRGCGGYYLK